LLAHAANLVPYERAKIADALDLVSFNDGDVILRQGDTTDDKFYIIESGKVEYWKGSSEDPSKEPILSGNGVRGDYFGEWALLENLPRQATVKAVGPVRCLCISKKHFEQVMGPCEAILRSNIGAYKTYQQLLTESASSAAGSGEKSSESGTTASDEGISMPVQATSAEYGEETRPTSWADFVSLFNDFIGDETDYVAVLTTLVEDYMKPLAAQNELTLPPNEISLMFGESERLRNLHRAFAASLKSIADKLNNEASPYSSTINAIGKNMLSISKAAEIYKSHVKTFYASVLRRAQRETQPTFVHLLCELEKKAPIDHLRLVAPDDTVKVTHHSRTPLGRLLDVPIRWPVSCLEFLRVRPPSRFRQ
jgi:CRP-like cAMP-binding protein